MRRAVLALGALALGAALLGGSSFLHARRQERRPQYILRYADNQPMDYPSTRGGTRFASLVEERTGGDVKIYVYGDGELGDEKSVIRQVQFGGIDFARVSSVQLSAHEPSLGVLSLPYLYRDADHLWRVLDGEVGDYYLETIGGSGVIGLSWYDAGARSFYTKERVETLEEFAGLSLRVQEADDLAEFVRDLGAVPKSMPYSLVYSSLSTGEVAGAENNWPSYETSQHYKIARYMLEDEHMRIPELQIISAKTVARLPEEYLEIIRECAKESALYERQLWKEWERAARERMIRAGVTVVPFSDEEREKFRAACRPLYEKYEGEYGDLIEKIREEGD